MIGIANLVCMGVNTLVGAIEVGTKVSEYDRNNWRAKDYAEVVLGVANIGVNVMTIHADYSISTAQKQLNKGVGEAQATVLKDSIKSATTKKAAGLAGNIVCNVGKDICQNKSMGQILLNPNNFVSAGQLVEIGGHQNIGEGISCVGHAISTAKTVKRTYGNLSRAYVNYYRRHVRLQNLADAANPAPANPAPANPAPANPAPANPAAPNPAGGLPPLTIPPADLNYALIPQQHHDDAVLTQYECLFTLCPIRYPVLIVNGGVNHYYELREVVRWVRDHGTNPLLVNEQFREQDLIVDVAAQRIIETRMRELGLL